MKQPKIQITLDCQGEVVTPAHLRHLEACIACLFGFDKVQDSFWITRDDLLCEFLSRNVESRTSPIGRDKFHEPTFDLYFRDHNPAQPIPIGRLINVKIPELTL